MRLRRGAALLLVASALAQPVGTPSAAPAAESSRRPDILLIITDDQAWSHFSRTLMPTVYSDIVDRGALFTRAYASSPVCCPSRAEMLTGLYEHHTNVDGNLVPLERPTIAMALHDAGYRTMMAGKYLNSWTSCAPRPEFDRWSCLGTPAPSTYSLIDPWINVDGRPTHFSGYQTDILAEQVTSFVAETPSDQPFFAIYAPTSPHSPADDPRYTAMPVRVRRSPSWDVETRTTDAPEYTRRFPLGPGVIVGTDRHYRKAAYSARALDDAVGSLLEGLGTRADTTLVLFISDNGYQFGEHRRVGKHDPFEESVRIPLAVRYPPALRPEDAFRTSELVANIDVAPTIADVAGLTWGADGSSLLPALRGGTRRVHDAVLLERCQGNHLVADPCSGLRFEDETVYPPAYEGVVTERYKYVAYANGDRQLFDLRADPYELVNLADDPGSVPVRRELVATLRRLRAAPPVETTVVTGPVGGLRERAAEFTFFSPTRFATYRCRLLRDGVPEAWHDCSGGSDVVGGLTDGRYEFEVAGTDETGATDDTPASRSFHVVTAGGPDVSIVDGPPDVQTEGRAEFRFATETAGALFRCRMARWGEVGSWEPCDGGAIAYSGLRHGVWRFDVRAVDPASGEGSRPPATHVLRVDTLGPTFAAAERPPLVTSSRRASFVIVSQEATTGRWTCSVDGASGTDCSDGRIELARLRPGAHTLSIEARDRLGTTATTVLTWVVDRTAPSVSIAEGPPQLSGAGTATFRFESGEPRAAFTCVLDAYPEMPCSQIWKIPAAGGAHELTVWAIDRALNRSRPATWTWTVAARAGAGALASARSFAGSGVLRP